MLSIASAKSDEDFETAARLCRALAEWDATVAPDHGLSPDMVRELFHGDCSASALKRQFSLDASGILVARWSEMPAGCLAFAPFDDNTMELHKFFVDPAFRGRGIGGALLRVTIAEAMKGSRKEIQLHTTAYMKNAVSLYEAVGFVRCPPFRAIPAEVAHTEVFMRQTLAS